MTESSDAPLTKISPAVLQSSAKTEKVSLTAQFATFSGPLPPPNMLQSYNDVVPNAAERIISVFEAEVHHRHNLEQAELQAEIKDVRTTQALRFLGIVCGFIICLVLVFTGAFLIYHDKQIAGFSVCVTSMAGIIAAFLGTKKTSTANQGKTPPKKRRKTAKR